MQTATAPITRAYWHWRGQSIFYVKAGSQSQDGLAQHPPLLLIHGFGASTDHWRKNIADLSQDHEVWAIDLLGFGRSAKPDRAYGGDVWRDQLHDFIQEVIGQPVVLAGNSLGGYAALCVAAQRPQSVKGVVLINSAGSFTETEGENKPTPFQQFLGEMARSLMLQPIPNFFLFQYVRQRSVIRQTLERVYLDKSAVTDELVEDIYRPSCDPGAMAVFASVFKSPQGEKVDALLRQVTCPLLAIWGEGDPWMNARARGVKFREHYPSLTEHYLHAGHCPHDEVPDQVDALIREWLGRSLK